ncbi:MAG: endonuclease III [Cyanobacteria bacterium]|nr:endonuclease III [Cyanobacteriota bacterium]
MASPLSLRCPKPPVTEPASPEREARRRERVMRVLARQIDGLELPAVEKISESQKQDPFQILISTLLSARTQDATTLAASTRLFAKASTPAAIAKLRVSQIEKLIYPVSFYRNKAVFVRDTARMIVDRFGGRVPSTLEELITLPGVGRKTANLVMILAFKSRDNICVDIHVHRIANRLGWVQTRTPEETEQALYKTLDRQWWPIVNLYLVTWGQNMCRPVYPRCGDCAIVTACRRVDVTRVGKSAFARASARQGVKRI